MKFSDIERGDLGINVDGPVRELMSLGGEVRKATGELARALDELSHQESPDISYENIDGMMRSVCKQHGCKASELHDDFVAAKGMTPDQYVRDQLRSRGKNMLEDSAFKEFDVFVVQIPANVYTGKYYDHRTVSYRVYKGMDGVWDDKDAMAWVNDNQDKVLADLSAKRMKVGSRTVPYVGKPAADNVFFSHSYRVKPSKVSRAVDDPNPTANYQPPATGKQELPVREHMLPGDVLMIESDSQAVVGTVLSIDEGMIILEGGVYPLDEEELDEIWPFKKKVKVAKPKRFPDRSDDLEQWMRDKIAYLKSTGADPAIVFSPATGDYFPLTFQAAFSYNDSAKRAYANIKREYPELVKRAREVVSDPLAMRISQSRVGDNEDWPENSPTIRESFPPAIIATLGKSSGGLNSYEIEVKVEDGSKTDLRITASNQQEALQKATKWAQKEYDHMGVECKIVGINEAEYQGREVKLGKPMRDASGSKKFKVYVRDPKTGNIKKVMFGDKNMEIKRDDPARRKSFRARHGCGTARASDRTKAAYWSCRLWSTKPVGDILKGK